MLQRELQQSLRSRALASHARLAELARPLDPARLVQRPSDGGWSTGQVLEHLCLSNEAYEQPIRRLLSAGRPDAAAPLREWTPMFFGKLLWGSLGRPARMRAPKGIAPGQTVRGGVVEDFLRHQQLLVTLIDDATGHDWSALRMGSPIVPSIVRPIFKLNLGDVFSVLVVHTERHTKQIERLVASTQ
jgi:hypothetical protein